MATAELQVGFMVSYKWSSHRNKTKNLQQYVFLIFLIAFNKYLNLKHRNTGTFYTVPEDSISNERSCSSCLF